MDLFDVNRKINIADEECECECGCEHDHEEDECECGCEDDEELQDGYHVLYCRGYLFDAVKLFDYAEKKEKSSSKTFALYNNFASDLKKNCITEKEPVIFLEYAPDAVDYYEVPVTDLKGRGYVLITGAELIKQAYADKVERVEYVTLKAEEYFPFMLFGQAEFAEHWNKEIDSRLHEKAMYENTKREQELSGE